MEGVIPAARRSGAQTEADSEALTDWGSASDVSAERIFTTILKIRRKLFIYNGKVGRLATAYAP